GLLDGTYAIQTLLGAQPTGVANRGTPAIVVAAGISTNQRTIVASVNPRGAILDWQRSMTPPAPNAAEGCTLAVGGDYITIDGLVFANNNFHAINLGHSQNYVGNFFTVQNCWFKGQQFDHQNTTGNNP